MGMEPILKETKTKTLDSVGSPNNGSMIKGVRMTHSESQAKLYFVPSIENQTDPPGPSLAKRLPLSALQTSF